MKMCIILLIMVLKCQIVIIDDIGMKGNTSEEYNGTPFKANLPLKDTLSKLYGNGGDVNDSYGGNTPLADLRSFNTPNNSNNTPYKGNSRLIHLRPFNNSSNERGVNDSYKGNTPLGDLKDNNGVLNDSGSDRGVKSPYNEDNTSGDLESFKTPNNRNNTPYKGNKVLNNSEQPNSNRKYKPAENTQNKPNYSHKPNNLQQIPIYSFQDIFNMKDKLNNEFSKTSNSNKKADKGKDTENDKDGESKEYSKRNDDKETDINTDVNENSNLNILEDKKSNYKSNNVEKENIKPKSSNSTDNSYNDKGNNTSISQLNISDSKVVKDNEENTELEIYKRFKTPIINTPSPIDISNEEYLGTTRNEGNTTRESNTNVNYMNGTGDVNRDSRFRDIKPRDSNSTIAYTINVKEGGNDVPKHENIPDMPSITHPYLSVDSLTPIHPYVPPSDSGSHPYLSANIDTLPNSDIFTQKKLMDKEKSNLKDANVARSSFLQLKYDESKNRLDSLKNSLNDLTSKLSILEEKMKERGMENDNLKETLRNNRNHLKNSKTNLEKIETEKHKIEAELRLDNNEIAKLNKKIDDLRNKVETLKAEQNVYRERGLTLDREVLQTDKNIKIEESKTREYKKEIESLKVLLNSLNERRSELVGKMSNEESLQSKIWMEMDRIRRSELSYFY